MVGTSFASPAVRQAALRGVIAGFVGMALFLVLHAFLVQPIWTRADGLLRGLGVAVVGGAVVGVAFDRVRGHMPGGPVAAGAMFGLVVALTLVPFILASALRIHGVGVVPWLLVLILLEFGAVGALAWSVDGMGTGRDGGRRALMVAGSAFVLNAYPGVFLLSLPELIPDRVPDPFPQGLALCVIYVVCGVVVGALSRAAPAMDEDAAAST